MQGECIDLPPNSVPWLYVVAGPPITANEQSIMWTNGEALTNKKSIYFDVYGLNQKLAFQYPKSTDWE